MLVVAISVAVTVLLVVGALAAAWYGGLLDNILYRNAQISSNSVGADEKKTSDDEEDNVDEEDESIESADSKTDTTMDMESNAEDDDAESADGSTDDADDDTDAVTDATYDADAATDATGNAGDDAGDAATTSAAVTTADAPTVSATTAAVTAAATTAASGSATTAQASTTRPSAATTKIIITTTGSAAANSTDGAQATTTTASASVTNTVPDDDAVARAQYAEKLLDFMRGSVGKTTAVQYDLDGDGVDELIAFDEGVQDGDHWAAVSEGAAITVFSGKPGEIVSSSVEPLFSFRTYNLYISNNNDIVIVDYDHGTFYQIYRYRNGSLSLEASFEDGSYGGDPESYYYSINDIECSLMQLSGALLNYGIKNEINADGYLVVLDYNVAKIISYGDMSLHQNNELLTVGAAASVNVPTTAPATTTGVAISPATAPTNAPTTATTTAPTTIPTHAPTAPSISTDFIPAGSQLDHSEIGAEVARIRAIWQADSDAISLGEFTSRAVESGVTAHYDANGRLKKIVIIKNTYGIEFSRTYQFSSGSLIFAYIEGDASHRLYFYNDLLFRWRYTPDIADPNTWTDYDKEWNSTSYISWNNFAIDEAYMLYNRYR